ncbi:Flp pilus assembly protein TadG [Variovorax sp. PBS-H4]|uniref:TadE family protein n=1 Tax=Variovorax sp. PBS-H4 TaxID=434008 RepID=UPI0013196545|nr:TadE family protein [Variovorax sp. PBS-H4]VTU26434.1 Flp pilus assembly protein TadG [Variovorax sp. PBS-H4]
MTTRKKQEGATIVEFALVLLIYLTFVLGIIDFSRMLWTWNAANEATRWGARVAVVCDRGAGVVLSRMRTFLPQLTAANVVVDWYDAAGNISAACTAASCSAVNVRIVNLDYQWVSPVAGAAAAVAPIPMPGFSTYLPREIMGQDPGSPAVCS